MKRVKAPRLSEREKAVIEARDIGRLATVSGDGWPHVVPVSYIYSKEAFYVPSRSDAVKVRNLKSRPRAAFVVDDEARDCGVILECRVRILSDADAKKWRRRMREEKGWKNDDKTVVMKLSPERKTSWFLRE